jgi:hypothetical protein
MIDRATAQLANAANGFKLNFSSAPSPGYTIKLECRREEFGGNWYWCEQFGAKGWLCPALSKYYPENLRQLYAQVSAV